MDRIFAEGVLTSENDSVTLENFELVHLGLGELNDGVVVLWRVLDLELVRRLFPLENRRRKIFLTTNKKSKIRLRSHTWEHASSPNLLFNHLSLLQTRSFV